MNTKDYDWDFAKSGPVGGSSAQYQRLYNVLLANDTRWAFSPGTKWDRLARTGSKDVGGQLLLSLVRRRARTRPVLPPAALALALVRQAILERRSPPPSLPSRSARRCATG
eukprot:1729963-Prymnesium_polylepis.1